MVKIVLTNFRSSIVFFLIVLLLLCSCAEKRPKLEPVEAIPVWFKVDDKYSHKDADGNFLVHPFFDLVPFTDLTDKMINFVLTTPQGSLYGYEFDLVSGRFYKERYHCSQKDVWKRYKGLVKYPPYAEGFIPRLLDQLGEPQKIVVFGGKDRFLINKRNRFYSHRVRIVGGVVEQYCRSYPCTSRHKWLSKLILVGVDPNNEDYKEVKEIDQLKKMVDWEYVLAFMQNSKGRTITSQEEYPAYRIVGQIESSKVLQFAISKGHYFKYKEIKTLRSSCHKLYELLWKKSKELRAYRTESRKLKKKIKEAKEKDREKFQSIKSSGIRLVQKIEEDSLVKKIKKIKKKSFAKYFKEFYSKYSDQYNTCVKYVRPVSINYNLDQHWFFVYLTAFIKLESLDYLYKCSKRAWMENPRLPNMRLSINPWSEYQQCTSLEFDDSFELAINMFASLRSWNRDHFRFITYDNSRDGTHHKIYSWIYQKGRVYNCTEEDPPPRLTKDEDAVFPDDVRWNRFYSKRKSRYDIIE